MSQSVTLTDALVSEPVTLINAFTVPPEESERFLHRWKDNARIMASQPVQPAKKHKVRVDSASTHGVPHHLDRKRIHFTDCPIGIPCTDSGMSGRATVDSALSWSGVGQ